MFIFVKQLRNTVCMSKTTLVLRAIRTMIKICNVTGFKFLTPKARFLGFSEFIYNVKGGFQVRSFEITM